MKKNFSFKDQPKCPQCFNYSLFNFIPESPNDIEIICQKHKNLNYSLEKYLNYVTSNEIRTKENIKSCQRHNNKPFAYYCTDCHQHFCTTCKSKIFSHETCNIIHLKVLNRANIKEIKFQIKAAYSYIDEYFSKLKQDALIMIRKQIHSVQKAYDAAVKRNKLILSLVNNLTDLYSTQYPNYFSYVNLLNNSTFNFSKANSLDTPEKIIDFFTNYSIVKKADLSSFFMINTINIIKDQSVNQIIQIDKNTIAFTTYLVLRIVDINTRTIEYSYIKSFRFKTLYRLEDYNFAIVDNGDVNNYSIQFMHYENKKLTVNKRINHAHLSDISGVIKITETLVASCGLYEKCIKVWSITNNYSLDQTILCYLDYINAIKKLNNKECILICGEYSLSAYLMIFHSQTYQVITTFKHIPCFNEESVIQNKNRIIVAGKNELNVIETKSFNWIYRISDKTIINVTKLISLNDELIMAIYKNGKSIIFSIFTYQFYSKKAGNNNSFFPIIKIGGNTFIALNGGNLKKVIAYLN